MVLHLLMVLLLLMDFIGFALDLDAGTMTFYKNNVSQGTAYSSLPAGI